VEYLGITLPHYLTTVVPNGGADRSSTHVRHGRTPRDRGVAVGPPMRCRWSSAFVLLLVSSCAGPGGAERTAPPPDSVARAAVPTIPGAADTTHPAIRRVVYVPVYSHIYTSDGDRYIDLTVTLSVRNTDPERPMTLTAVQYFNTAGRLMRVYQDRPTTLAPLETKEFVLPKRDTAGGSGANFIVEWTARQSITEPVVEAVMISGGGTVDLSFVSVGRPLLRR